MDRRKFLKISSIAGVGIAAGCKKDILEPQEVRLETPVLIIGSGFGGSVTALRLSQKGIKNMLIERGRSWESNDFCSLGKVDKRSTWLRKDAFIPIINLSVPISKYTGVIEYNKHKNMTIFNAAGLGGGSLVFGATFVKPDKFSFEQVFPSEISYDEMDEKYFDKVRQEIKFDDIPEDIYQSEYYLYSRAFTDQAEKAGMKTRRLVASYNWDIVRQEMRGELSPDFIYGDGMFGTRNGSKNSLDKNYIKRAVATGNTQVYTQTNVTNISIRSDKKYEVEADHINPSGRVVKKVIIVCDKLFLCAGAPNTIKLLLKAKSESNLRELNSQIGKGFGTNGKVFFRRVIKENTGGYTGWAPGLAVRYYDNPHVPILIENIPQPLTLVSPFKFTEIHSHLHAALALSKYRGSYSYDPLTDKLNLDWDKTGLDDAVAAARHWTEVVNAANPGSETDTLLIPDKFLNKISYHPLGGCVIGEATDTLGRVLEYPNLYVNDGTLVPGVTAANPAFVIAALAERNIDKIIQEDFS